MSEKKHIEQLLREANARVQAMTPAERNAMVQAQAESWARAMAPCEHGIVDWEDCTDCRRIALSSSPEGVGE